MSVDQLPSGRARPAERDAQYVRYDEFVDKQIQSTRYMVKAVDVLTALLTMAIGVLGFLLAAAIVEHWLLPGGFNLGVRLLLFVALIGGLSYYAARQLWPLCVGSINPAYAAHAIEEDNPSLKNSLLNLLLIRQHRDEVTKAVYETLEEQAAQRLTRVPVESAVDRTQLLRLGYVLMVIVAAVAIYKIFSPKDPLVTAERVLMPWAKIVPASRVSIENVKPGATTLARGELLAVSADVLGIGDDDPVVLRYTTADGQAVDRPVPMKPSAAGLRFTGQIPPATDGAKAGVAQNLRYRIEAGDARSLEYSVAVVAAPTMTVERIDYDYPDYTGFIDRSVERLGDVRAVEGTRVTVHARANQPIEQAAVDFEADGRRDVRLEVDGSDAQASFLLELRDDRRTPKFTSYVLRFTGTDGRPNRDPVKFPIDVLPDYGPEAAITAPAEKVRDVRLDETVAIEVDARDPDFALSEVRLHGEAAGRAVLDELLLAEEHTGRFTGRQLFTPSEHGLHVGDSVRYWVTARDNRARQANETISDSQTLRIVSPDPSQPGQPPQDRIAQRGKREPQAGDQSQQGEQQQGEGEQSAREESDSSQGEQGESTSADGQSGQTGKRNSADSTGDQSGESSSEQSDDQTGESQSGGESGSDGQLSASEKGGKSGTAQQQPGGTPSVGRNGETSSQSKQSQSQQPSGGESSGDDATEKARPPSGKRSQSKPGAESSPVSPEGDNDGEAFDRIQEFLRREGQLPKESQDQDGQPGESASADSQKREDGKRESQPTDASDAKSKSGDQADSNAAPKNPQPSKDAQPGDSHAKTNESADRSKPSQPSNGQETTSQGEPGASDRPEKGQGQPEPQPSIKPGDKWQQTPSDEHPGDQQEAPSGGQGKRRTDTLGEQGGNRSGGGEEGSGQKGNRDGTGSAGQNQSADEGAGESSEQGAGRSSSSAGQDAKANEQPGESSSDETGTGSRQHDGKGENPGGGQDLDGVNRQGNGGNQQSQSNKTGEPASAGEDQPKNSTSQPSQPSHEQPTGSSQDSGSGTPDGAGRVPNGTMQPTKSVGTAPDADAVNIEYARKQTDLVLETLAEQMKRQKVDKRLLDKLGWTEAELRRFVERWQQLKQAARSEGPDAADAQRELDDALRSLGLRHGPLQQSKVSDDSLRNLRQGYRGAVPLEYQDRLRAYNQGVSRARQVDEYDE